MYITTNQLIYARQQTTSLLVLKINIITYTAVGYWRIFCWRLMSNIIWRRAYSRHLDHNRQYTKIQMMSPKCPLSIDNISTVQRNVYNWYQQRPSSIETKSQHFYFTFSHFMFMIIRGLKHKQKNFKSRFIYIACSMVQKSYASLVQTKTKNRTD